MPNCKHPELFIDHINEVFNSYGWDDIPIQAAFLGQIAHESTELNQLAETCNYSAKFLITHYKTKFVARNPYDYVGKPEAIANIIYAKKYENGDIESGDGWRYRGRGAIQITFKYNYWKIGQLLNMDFVESPELLEEPEWAIKSAGAFFKWQKLDELAKKNDLDALTAKINAAGLGSDQRNAYTKKAAEVLKWTS